MVRPLTRARFPAVTAAMAGAALTVVLSACSSGPGRAPAAGSSSTTTTSTTTSTTLPAGLAYLTAWGATLASWNDNHTVDPSRPHAYWPRLPDDRDTYTDLSLPAGRVVGYVLALDPSVAVADARSRLANDLPLDAQTTQDRVLAGCELMLMTGPTIDAIAPGGVLAEFTSVGGAYQAGAVATVTVSPLGQGQPVPGHC